MKRIIETPTDSESIRGILIEYSKLQNAMLEIVEVATIRDTAATLSEIDVIEKQAKVIRHMIAIAINALKLEDV